MKQLLLLLFFLTTSSLFAQTKIVLITKNPKIVPSGKKWQIVINKPVKIQVVNGALNSGTMCNAMLQSNSKVVYNINSGTFSNATSFGIAFTNLEKVPYTNNVSFLITPLRFIDNETTPLQLQKLQFLQGESVFIGNCLQSIEMIEVSMTQQEILEQRKKENQQEEKEQYISSNFNIPINTHKYVATGTKPQIHDRDIKSIVFKSNAVLWTKPYRGNSVDESEWTLSLTQKTFEMQSMNYEKKFKVIGVKYDEAFQAQRFALSDDNGKHTFDLLISYSLSSISYSVIVTSLDHKEDYQFQDISLKEKYVRETSMGFIETDLISFNIPDLNVYNEKEDSPIYKDKALKNINFSSNDLSHRFETKWTGYKSKFLVFITPNEIRIENDKKQILKSYKVGGIKYSKEYRSEQFKLSTNGKTNDYDLLLSYSSVKSEYSVMILSTDDKEEFHFKEVLIIEK